MKSDDWNAQTREEVEKVIGYQFRDEKLLKRCFTHSSYSNLTGEENNERLEFLGDAVLGLCVAEKLFLDDGNKDEGALTNLRQDYVSQEALTESEKKLDLMRFLRYCGKEGNVDGKTPSNLFEAVVAGIYLDGGLKAARKFVEENTVYVEGQNYKSKLQEFVQERERTLPIYGSKEEDGHFLCKVSALGKSASAVGENKKAAEKEAAKKLYQILSARERS